MFITELLRQVGLLVNALPAAHVLLADGFFLIAFVAAEKWLGRFVPIYIFFVFPGTVAHELAHWGVATITNGKPGWPNFFPQRHANGLTLGHVAFNNPRWYNTAFIALAPLLLLPLVAWLYLHEVAKFPLRHVWHWFGLYLVIVAGFSALPSTADMRLAWKYSKTVLLIIAVGGLSIWLRRYW
jgi:hypothetical protein